MTFSLMQESELTLFQAQWNDWISQGVGEELMDMGPEESSVEIYTKKTFLGPYNNEVLEGAVRFFCETRKR